MKDSLRVPAAASALAAALLLVGQRIWAQDLPLFDAHIHYNQPAWSTIDPRRALDILERAGIVRAIVSSTPDEGTRRLYELAPQRIVPFLRLYRDPADPGRWTTDTRLLEYMDRELQRGIYQGIGEVHLEAAQADGPVVRRAAELAGIRGLFLQVHTDDAGIRRLLELYPGVRMLWAHAGMTAGPQAVERLLERSPDLWVELALRRDVAPGGTLAPDWRALFMRFPDRFLVGTDTWVTSRWAEVEDEAAFTRRWLLQLPREVREKIAFGNGQRLFGAARVPPGD